MDSTRNLRSCSLEGSKLPPPFNALNMLGPQQCDKWERR